MAITKDEAADDPWARTKEEVKVMIAPYKHSETMPPFSALVLMTMALVLNNGNAPRKTMIQTLLNTFKHFQIVAAQAFQNMFGKNESTLMSYIISTTPDPPFYAEAMKVLKSYNSPFIWVEGKMEWTITVLAARNALGLDTSAFGTFPFARLPPELRQRIYELAFTFPNAWILPSTDRSHLSVHENKDQTPFKSGTYMKRRCYGGLDTGDDNVREIQFPGTEKFLVPLLVNKMIYQEAGALFYTKHMWYFDNVGILSMFLSGKKKRYQHIFDITIIYDVVNRPGTKPAFVRDADEALRRLPKLTNLKKLRIIINEGTTVRNFKPVEGKRGFKPERIPGFKHLTQLRGLEEVIFEGQCPRIRDALVPLLTAPKAQKEHDD